MEDTDKGRREAQYEMTTMKNRKTDSGSGDSAQEYTRISCQMAVVNGIIDRLRQLSIAQLELIREYGSGYIDVQTDV